MTGRLIFTLASLLVTLIIALLGVLFEYVEKDSANKRVTWKLGIPKPTVAGRFCIAALFILFVLSGYLAYRAETDSNAAKAETARTQDELTAAQTKIQNLTDLDLSKFSAAEDHLTKTTNTVTSELKSGAEQIRSELESTAKMVDHRILGDIIPLKSFNLYVFFVERTPSSNQANSREVDLVDATRGLDRIRQLSCGSPAPVIVDLSMPLVEFPPVIVMQHITRGPACESHTLVGELGSTVEPAYWFPSHSALGGFVTSYKAVLDESLVNRLPRHQLLSIGSFSPRHAAEIDVSVTNAVDGPAVKNYFRAVLPSVMGFKAEPNSPVENSPSAAAFALVRVSDDHAGTSFYHFMYEQVPFRQDWVPGFDKNVEPRPAGEQIDNPFVKR